MISFSASEITRLLRSDRDDSLERLLELSMPISFLCARARMPPR